jgi:alkylated DNA nucleotide flippase Atl1
MRIVAETAEEDLREEREEITACWRVIKPDGSLNEKFPGGVEAQTARMREEEHIVELGRGKKAPWVKEFEKYLQTL